MPIPNLEAAVHTASTSTATLAVTKPTGTAAGDVWVVFGYAVGAANTLAMSGFNTRANGDTISGGDAMTGYIFDRYCDGSEGATSNMTVASTNFAWASSFRLSGCPSTGFYDTSVQQFSDAYILGRDLPDITTGGADRILLAGMTKWYTTLDTNPSEWTIAIAETNQTNAWERDAATAGTYTTASFDDASDFELWMANVAAYVGASASTPRRPARAWASSMGLR